MKKTSYVNIVALAAFTIAFILNIQTNLQGKVGLWKQLVAQTGSGSGSGSGGPTYQPYRQGCTKKKWFLRCGTVTTDGHETVCKIVQGGSTSCTASPCDAPEPSC